MERDLKNVRPPRWAVSLLRWYCRPDVAEDLEGDLEEYFARNLATKGPMRAKLIYIADVFKFIRPYTIRRPEFINFIIQFIMLNSYIKTSGRSILRNRLFSFINIAGLAISMSVGLLLIGVLNDVHLYDKFHTNHNRIYRVISSYEYMGKAEYNDVATTSLRAARGIRDNMTGAEAVTIIHRDFGGDVKAGDKTIPLNGLWANGDFFKVFSFRLQKGNQATALNSPFSAVLTADAARRLFGDEEALGKSITIPGGHSFTVTGVMEDIPEFSIMRFDLIGSISTRESLYKDDKSDNDWSNIWNAWAYLLLPEDADLDLLQAKLNELSRTEDQSTPYTHVGLRLQAFDDIMTGPDLGNEIGHTIGATPVWIFTGLAFVVILSACINYTNLSVARAMRRTKEVSIRKVIGAMKAHVIGQFIVEAVMISLSALLFSLVIFYFIRPFFIEIGPLSKILHLRLSLPLLGWFGLFAILVGIAAGLFPALFFSRIQAISALKDAGGMRVSGRLTFRKILMVSQYAISLMFICGTIVMYKQYRHFLAFDLGFTTENVFNIRLHGVDADRLKKDIAEMPEVKDVSSSAMITSTGNYWSTTMKYPGRPDDSLSVAYNKIDEFYLGLHQYKLLAGRNFNPKTDSARENEVIVNERLLREFQIAGGEPEKAIGEPFIVDRHKTTIVGVIRDFHYGSATSRESLTPVAFRYANKADREILNVKILSTDWLATRARLEAIWKKHDAVHPFDGKLYDDQLEASYSGMAGAVKVAGFLSVLAICISFMGLLGMVVFTTEIRLREISIRKVLGASEGKLLVLLGRGFFILLIVAAAIALPVTIIFFEQVAFQELGNHAPLQLNEMLLGVLAVLGMAGLVIGVQTLKVARSNPAEVLKAE